MATCNRKYTKNELPFLTDRVENALGHDTCREEFRNFLKKRRQHDLISLVNIWELAHDIRKNKPGTPERQRKLKDIQDAVESEPTFAAFSSDSDIVVKLLERIPEKLEPAHKLFSRYLKHKYPQ